MLVNIIIRGHTVLKPIGKVNGEGQNWTLCYA